ncbi:NUDIX hydrolase [Methylophaga sp. UBA3191]|uniref:NUDIX hydrolase n=1 Tax=Methylophaga sp. UBA3191 TaxID=1946881 RepID=UPI000C60818A|nr:NUDIX hydrolase [Methylophaga sp. UBA3191]MBN48555.1 NUDIX hydrolase [Spongiibacteraceae bacterium]
MTDKRPWHAHVTVATVVERNGRFLMVQERAEGRTVINQPAGHLDPGESLIAAAERETREETGWQVAIQGLIGASLFEAANGVTYYRTSFFADVVAEIPDATLDKGIIQPLWLSRDELLERADELRSELVLATIDQYLAGHRYPLNLLY